jgi:hypothetical protein
LVAAEGWFDALDAAVGRGVSGARAVSAGRAAGAAVGVSVFATGAAGVATAATFFAHPLQIKHEATPQAARIFRLIFYRSLFLQFGGKLSLALSRQDPNSGIKQVIVPAPR